MVFEAETWQRLALGGAPIIISLWLFFASGKEKWTLISLVIGAFTLRLVMISLDPFLHNYDERFHALVAKNLMDYPLKPMLKVNPVLPYNYQDWCCNHVWLHKQPLFMWQMAASMKLFGINEMAMRLPSAIMGAITTYFVFDITKWWTKNFSIAFIAAFLFSFCHFQLELTSGRFGMEHNDVAFTFYITASIWALSRYLNRKNIYWVLLIGFFAGAAILTKWLAGLLVFGGWGLYILLDKTERFKPRSYWYLAVSLFVAVLVFLPWQIYIISAFPLESSWEYQHNSKHIFEAVEQHKGDAFFHIDKIPTLYGNYLVWVLLTGIVFAFIKHRNRRTFVLLTMALVVYIFFSVVATKITGFTFIVAAIAYGFIAIGVYYLASSLGNLFPHTGLQRILLIAITLLCGYFTLRPIDIASSRSIRNKERKAHFANAEVFRSLPDGLGKNYILFNCTPFDDVALMFYKDCTAYNWYPSEETLNELLHGPYKVAAFQTHGIQKLPGYIINNPKIEIIHKELR